MKMQTKLAILGPMAVVIAAMISGIFSLYRNASSPASTASKSGSGGINSPVLVGNQATNINITVNNTKLTGGNSQVGGGTQIQVTGGNNQFGNENIQIINPDVTNELKKLQQKTMSQFFQPLDLVIRSNLVYNLRTIQSLYFGTNRVRVGFRFIGNNKNRSNFNQEWIAILNEAGYDASPSMWGQVYYDGAPPDVQIKSHPDDRSFCEAFCFVMQDLVNVRFSLGNGISKGQLEITVNGDPLFSGNGIVEFK